MMTLVLVYFGFWVCLVGLSAFMSHQINGLGSSYEIAIKSVIIAVLCPVMIVTGWVVGIRASIPVFWRTGYSAGISAAYGAWYDHIIDWYKAFQSIDRAITPWNWEDDDLRDWARMCASGAACSKCQNEDCHADSAAADEICRNHAADQN